MVVKTMMRRAGATRTHGTQRFLRIGSYPPAPSPTRGEGEQDADSAGKSAIETELAQWERFALNRLDKPEQTRPFEVTSLPDELAFEVSAGLLFARDRESVNSVFAGVRAVNS